MSFLLAPGDERELTEFLCKELGARLLLSDIAPAGQPQIASEPLGALPSDLPLKPTPGCHEIYWLLFWLPDCGPVRTMSQARAPATADERVSRVLTQASAGEHSRDVIDYERTPMLRLGRSKRMSQSRLAPGTLASMPLRSKAVPTDVRRMHAKAVRWLKSRGVKTDPFSHCPEVETKRPHSLGPLWVWVQPSAMKLVEQGAEIWPWNA